MSDAQRHDRHTEIDQPRMLDASTEPVILSDPVEPVEGGTDGPRQTSRSRTIGLAMAAVVALAGAAVFGTFGWRVATQQDAQLETPNQLAGLVRDDSERARETVGYLLSAFSADIELDQSVGAVYTDPAAADRSVLIIGGTTLLWQPESDLDELFTLLSDNSGQVSEVREVPAGTLGGIMKCGVVVTDGTELAACGWADHGSVAMAMFPKRSVSDSAQLLRDMRAGMQIRR